MLRWLLILTKPSGERTAKFNLERQGYRVYYPRLLRPVFQRGRWADHVVSLFPRYLFLQCDVMRQSLSPVRSTTGVASIVRIGAECAMVPDAVVDGLMRRADPESGLHRLNRTQSYECGTAVKIIAGAFEGLEGIFERETADDRVIVLLSLLGQDTPVRVPAQFVAARYA